MQRQFEAGQVAVAFGVRNSDVEHLGTGAFGETWRVGHDDAFKIIYADDFPEERLNREVDGLLKIRDSRVVRLRERLTIEIAGRTRPALRFEFIPGCDLARLLTRGPLSPDQVVEMTRELLYAVAVLHSAQLVHRDIKPANIALRGGDPAKPVLLDLGLAKPLDLSSVTAYPLFIGTMPFAAPEQLRGERARNAADLWSIGVVAALALTGKHPYWKPELAAEPEKLLAALTAVEPRLPHDAPPSLQKAVGKLLSPRKSERGSAGTVARLLTDSGTVR